jgi:hypothetical protein
MAATRATAVGYGRNGQVSTATRLGHASAVGRADTWRTFATAETHANGSGDFALRRDGQTIARVEWPAESDRDNPRLTVTFGNGRTYEYGLFTGDVTEMAANPNGAYRPNLAENTEVSE